MLSQPETVVHVFGFTFVRRNSYLCISIEKRSRKVPLDIARDETSRWK